MKEQKKKAQVYVVHPKLGLCPRRCCNFIMTAKTRVIETLSIYIPPYYVGYTRGNYNKGPRASKMYSITGNTPLPNNCMDTNIFGGQLAPEPLA